MKAQRLKITEKGWETYSDYFAGIKFTDGLSDEPVAPSVASQIGAYIRIEAVDAAEQVGEGRKYEKAKKTKAPVVVSLEDQNITGTENSNAPKGQSTLHTRAALEELADKEGIQGLRTIAESLGVKGRGIVELIQEILRAQGQG